MARHAANSITRQGAIDIALVARSRVRIVSRVDQFPFKVAFTRPAVIVIETSFTHHAVTPKARVVNRPDHFLNFRRIVFEETFYERDFAVELCIEDRIAARQAHGRPTPFAVW